MNTDFRSLVTAHVEAVTALLRGDRGIRPGVAIIATEPLDRHGQIAVAEMAAASRTDVLVLEFSPVLDGRVKLLGINVVMERDGTAYYQAKCSFWLSPQGNRAVILPQPESRGHFRLGLSEILHIDGKPAPNPAAGIERANAWLDRRLRSQDGAPKGVRFVQVPRAA